MTQHTILLFYSLSNSSFVWMTFATHESPEHLVKVKQNKKAIKALNTFRSTKESAKKRYNEIILKNKNKETSNFIKRCAEPVVWKPFLIVTSLQIVQQFAMMGILNKYVVVIFQDTFQDTFNSSSISTDIMIASDDVTNDIPGLPPPLTFQTCIDSHCSKLKIDSNTI